MPSWFYEPTCHYGNYGYWRHLKLNLEQIIIWVLFREVDEDIAFEKRINASWSFVFRKLFRWQAGAKYKPEFN
jgi:hypothetical protein